MVARLCVPGTDWFHLNASTYDPSDNTVIVSSREGLIKVNYSTLRYCLDFRLSNQVLVSLTESQSAHFNAGGDYPIGQHAVSITSDGYIMVFNDGYGSASQPSGEPAAFSEPIAKCLPTP